jgi:NitT/TauT family transport system permease protein
MTRDVPGTLGVAVKEDSRFRGNDGWVWLRGIGWGWLPFLTVCLGVVMLWYMAAYWVNAPQAQALMDPDGPQGVWAVVRAAWSMDTPVVPTPDQVFGGLYHSIFDFPLNSPRNFLLQAGYTAETAVTGLALGLAAGILLAVGIVHSRVLDRSLMPWVIGSQTVPILAIAPMIMVALGNIGVTGLAPKAAIVGYLSFFPVAVGMVKGLRSPDAMHIDLMRSYDASAVQVFTKLRWPVSLGFLFPGLKIAAALSVTGAIVAELPTGAQVGLGARLLAGSYYGQPLMMWGALVLASLLALAMIFCVRLAEVAVTRRRGGRL